MSRRENQAPESYVVYQDLNEPTNVFVARADEVVAGTFRMVAGPFAARDRAEQAASELLRAPSER